MKIETFALPEKRAYGSAANYRRVGVRLGIYNDKYDDVVAGLFDSTRVMLNDCYMFLLHDGGFCGFHDRATGQISFGLAVRTEESLTPSVATQRVRRALDILRSAVVGKAMGQKKRKALVGKIDLLAEALGGHVPEAVEPEEFGRPYTPVQAELRSALLDEISRLEDEQNAAEDAEHEARNRKKREATAKYNRKIDWITGQRQAAVRAINAESSRNVVAIRRKYEKKIDELRSQLAEAV